MCPPPCGPRRYSNRCYLPKIKTRISKRETAEVIKTDSYETTFRSGDFMPMTPYEATTQQLLDMLWDKMTKVRVSGRRDVNYREGYRSIVMDAPSLPGIIIIRTTDNN